MRCSPANYGELKSDGTLSTTVTDSNNNDTVHVFSTYANAAAGSVSGATACQGLVETSTRAYQGTGTSRTLRTQTDVNYVAAKMSSAETTGASDLQPIVDNIFATSVTTTNGPTNKVMKVVRTPDTGFGNGGPTFGETVVEKIYDWGRGAPGALLKETDTNYVWQSDGRYTFAGLVDLVASETIKDGSGNQVAETTHSYDNGANLYPSNITVQHVAAPNVVRGNRSSISRWLNNRSAPLVVPVDIYDTGMPYDSVQPGNTSAAYRTNFMYNSTGTYVIETVHGY
jgi:hypothetical protein